MKLKLIADTSIRNMQKIDILLQMLHRMKFNQYMSYGYFEIHRIISFPCKQNICKNYTHLFSTECLYNY